MYTCKHNNRGKRNSNWIFMKTLTSFSTSYIIRIIIMHFYLFSIETYEVCLAEQKQEFRKKIIISRVRYVFSLLSHWQGGRLTADNENAWLTKLLQLIFMQIRGYCQSTKMAIVTLSSKYVYLMLPNSIDEMRSVG